MEAQGRDPTQRKACPTFFEWTLYNLSNWRSWSHGDAVSVATEFLPDLGVRLYPKGRDDRLEVRLSSPFDVELTLIDPLGAVLFTCMAQGQPEGGELVLLGSTFESVVGRLETDSSPLVLRFLLRDSTDRQGEFYRTLSSLGVPGGAEERERPTTLADMWLEFLASRSDGDMPVASVRVSDVERTPAFVLEVSGSRAKDDDDKGEMDDVERDMLDYAMAEFEG